MDAPPTLFRFPGPLALRAILDGAPPTLHRDDAHRVYLGEVGLFGSWPGPQEFGALGILDAPALRPRPGEWPGWWLVAPQPLDAARAVYVPNRACAQAVVGAADRAEALRALPPHYEASVAEARGALDDYARILERVHAALARLDGAPPEALRAQVETPLHMQPADARARLAEALESLP